MDGGRVVGDSDTCADFDLPTVLAQLDGDEAGPRRDAVETIREHVETDPDACLTAVPKLRRLLSQPDLECHEAVATCLARLAAHSPVDVAPSADEIAAFVTANPAHSATPAAYRCLAAIATERPEALVDHVPSLVDSLENATAEGRTAGTLVLARVAAVADVRLGSERERVLERLATEDPDRIVRDRTRRTLERLS
ncbi:hypothetical protein [Halopiger goleimassiliensis]|uniref:hypothetical protein n=1 Tax=Halopiger goleimassiliensis TaxID=1293048 RepID=UPI000677846F|nr:hypothetical protein [Halopiger goleimassiliensis]